MQPMGRVPSRFPGKRDVHPRKPYVNWWELEMCSDGNKQRARMLAWRQLKDILQKYVILKIRM